MFPQRCGPLVLDTPLPAMTQARRLLAASLLAVAAGLFAAPRAQAAPVASPAGVAEFEPFRNHGAAM